MTTPSTAARRRGALGAALLALVAPVALATPAHASTTQNEVVFTADEDNDGVYSVVLRNMETRQNATVLPADTTDEWIYDDPELSPNGSQVALSTDRGSTAFDEGIAVVNRDGSGFRRLTEPPQTDTSYSLDVAPAWSPDGSRIVFTRITSTDESDSTVSTALFVVSASGGTPTALAQAGNGYTADWSPDGSKIVFAALEPGQDSGPLTVVNANGSGTPLSLGVTGLMPAWSPDGTTIAYATVTSRDPDRVRAQDTAQIATVPATGGTQRVLAGTRPDPAVASVAEYPAWTPDGAAIVYDLFGYSTTDEFPPGDLWAIDEDGSRAGRVMATPGDEAQPHLQGPTPSSVVAGAPSTYVPVTPQRVLDSRPAPNNVGVRPGKVGAGGTVDLTVHGLTTAEGAIPSTATAVVLNVTATGTTAATDVRVYPAGTNPVPRTSNLNAKAGQTVPNLVTATLSSGGAVTIRNAGGEAHLIADIAGYYVPAGTSGSNGFTALDPGRILDTRNGVGAAKAPVTGAGFVDLKVTGALPTADGGTRSVPTTARAVVLNVTATNVSANTDVRVYPAPADGEVPTVSNLNLVKGQTAPNLVTVAVPESGIVRLRNQTGSVDLIADIAGYYSAESTSRFVPITPLRFLDTRSGLGAAPVTTRAAESLDLAVAGTRGIPAGATAVVMNLTGTSVSTTTDVRAYPAGTATVPTVSNLNLYRDDTRANSVIVKVGAGDRVRVRNAGGELHLISDVAGYMIG